MLASNSRPYQAQLNAIRPQNSTSRAQPSHSMARERRNWTAAEDAQLKKAVADRT